MSHFSRTASPLAQKHSVVFHNSDREYYVESSGLTRLDNGDLLAVIPVVPRGQWSKERRVTESRTYMLRSSDQGGSWQQASILPYYSAVPWVYNGTLYLFANKGGSEFRNDDLLLLRSSDHGAAWSEPVTLFQGHFWNCDTSIVIRNDTLYWAIDDLNVSPTQMVMGNHASGRGPRVIAGDLSADPMNPQAWRMSNGVAFPGIPELLLNSKFSHLPSHFLEPNLIDVCGQLRVLMTVKPAHQSTTGLCAVLDVHDQAGQLELEFVQYHPMPGGQLKFSIEWDAVSNLFWAAVNLAVDGQNQSEWWSSSNETRHKGGGGNDRRFLMLYYGLDGLNWFPAGCIAQAAKLSQSFHYPKLIVDGDDLAIVARTNFTGPNSHDADCATFHRVRNFRELALNLIPDPEEALNITGQ